MTTPNEANAPLAAQPLMIVVSEPAGVGKDDAGGGTRHPVRGS